MVAVGDFGCAERERMVALAIEHGWIQKVFGWATDRGTEQPVAVLATANCRLPPGPLGKVVQKAVGGMHAMPAAMRRAQAAAGCSAFVVFTVPLGVLVQLVDKSTADDLREVAARNQYAVLGMNDSAAVLISGVSPVSATEDNA